MIIFCGSAWMKCIIICLRNYMYVVFTMHFWTNEQRMINFGNKHCQVSIIYPFRTLILNFGAFGSCMTNERWHVTRVPPVKWQGSVCAFSVKDYESNIIKLERTLLIKNTNHWHSQSMYSQSMDLNHCFNYCLLLPYRLWSSLSLLNPYFKYI